MSVNDLVNTNFTYFTNEFSISTSSKLDSPEHTSIICKRLFQLWLHCGSAGKFSGDMRVCGQRHGGCSYNSIA